MLSLPISWGGLFTIACLRRWTRSFVLISWLHGLDTMCNLRYNNINAIETTPFLLVEKSGWWLCFWCFVLDGLHWWIRSPVFTSLLHTTLIFYIQIIVLVLCTCAHSGTHSHATHHILSVSVFLSVCLSVCLYLSVSLSISLSHTHTLTQVHTIV